MNKRQRKKRVKKISNTESVKKIYAEGIAELKKQYYDMLINGVETKTQGIL